MEDVIAGTAVAGTDGGVATAVADAPAPETDVVETGLEPATTETNQPETTEEPSSAEPDQSTEPEPESEEESVEGDGRRVDAKTRQIIADLKKTNPTAAKALADSYFRNQAVVQAVGAENMKDALASIKDMRAQFEALGGDEGITGLQSEVEDYRREIEQFSQGDPTLITQLQEANPEAFVGNVAASLDLLESKDLKGFDKAVVPALARRLESVGMYQAIANALALVKEGKGQETYDLLNKVNAWLGNVKDTAKQVSDGRNVKDPREEQFAAREQALTQKEQQQYEMAVGSKVTALNNALFKRIIAPLVKELGLGSDGEREFTQGMQAKVFAAMKADKKFQRLAHAIKTKGDATRTTEFIHDKVKELASDFYIAHRNAMYPNLRKAKSPTPITAAKAAAPTNGKAPVPADKKPAAPVAGQPFMIAKRPDRENIDWSKTSDPMFLGGRAHLKDGKFVTWDWRRQ